MIVNSISDICCHYLFYKLENFISTRNIFIKLEGLNIAGSIKLTTAKGMLDQLIAEKKIAPGNKIIESSSGNLGIALSILCKERGIPFLCVIDPNIAKRSKRMLQLYGAEIIQVDIPDQNGGYLGSRIKMIESILATDPNIVWINQYSNPYNPIAHSQKTAREIADTFPKIDYLFIGAGTTGTLMGCAAFFRTHRPETKIIAVDATGSVTFGEAPKKRYIPGLGTSRKPPIADKSLVDKIIYVDESDTIKMCRKMLSERGLFLGGSTGTVLHAIFSSRNEIPPEATVVAISPDFGDKYLDTIYDDEWVEEHFGELSLPIPTKEIAND